MGSIFDDQGALPGVISSAVKQLIDNAKGLGLTWTLRLATMSGSSSSSGSEAITGVMDGDTVPIGLTNITGNTLPAGSRVYVLIIPPSGNFIIGAPESIRLGANCNYIDSSPGGSSTVPTYFSQPGGPTVVLTKTFAATNLKFSWAQSYYTTGGQVDARFALLSSSFGYVVPVGKNFQNNNALGAHTPISGVNSMAGVPAGTLSWTGAWAAAGGPGTLNVDASDYFSLCIEEFWPSD